MGGYAQAQDPYPAPANCESTYLLKKAMFVYFRTK
jgi:hypothetical protein